MDVSTVPIREQLWFMNTLVTVHRSAANQDRGLSVLEHRAPLNDSPPLHVHTTEDEVFIVLDGELRILMGDVEQSAKPGAVLVAPKNVPHTYRVDSHAGARWLTVTDRGDFERFVRKMARPAATTELPIPTGPPSAAEVLALSDVARQFGIQLVGPPLSPQ
jgi:mannose-6-phosphate isomerase-like protein (cupin superfamily)